MSEYHPDLEPGYYNLPLPKYLPAKDPNIEEDAIIEIMSLAIFGASTKAVQEGDNVQEVVGRVFRLFKDVGFIK